MTDAGKRFESVQILGMDFVRLPAGTFFMGASATDPDVQLPRGMTFFRRRIALGVISTSSSSLI